MIHLVLQALPPPAPAQSAELASYGVAKSGLGVPIMSMSAENKLLIAQVIINTAYADARRMLCSLLLDVYGC